MAMLNRQRSDTAMECHAKWRSRRIAPQTALLVTTYEKPAHLERVLASIARQQAVREPFEVVVADDGSLDATPDIVARFADEVAFPVTFTTHAHHGFRAGKCRNDAVRASSAPYLLFVDGDCILPADHVAKHQQYRRRDWVMAGYCYRLDRRTSEALATGQLDMGAISGVVPRVERYRVARRRWKSHLYAMLRHSGKPRLAGGNVGMWRHDYERVNGYDELFVGWGGEDDDLGLRLRRAGLRVGSSLGWNCTYHLWHPPSPLKTGKYWECVNVDYLHRRGRLTRCRHGLVTRSLRDIAMEIVGRPQGHADVVDYIANVCGHGRERSGHVEVEIVFCPGAGEFTGNADCNVLVDLGGPNDALPARVRKMADLLASRRHYPEFADEQRLFGLDQVSELFAAIS